MHVVFMLEEPSAEALLDGLLPRLLPPDWNFELVCFQGKRDLLNNLPARLRAYASWMPSDWRIVVLIDEDRQDCRMLKQRLEAAAKAASLTTKSSSSGGHFVVLNRIAVEELEAWFFGDTEALRAAFPGIPATIQNQAKYRDPDSIQGGTWEALLKILQRAGHFRGGLGKIQLARMMGLKMVPERNRSPSFQQFACGLRSIKGP